MKSHWVKNYDFLATTEERQKALQIIEAGLSAVDTEKIMEACVSLVGDTLKVKDEEFNLEKYRNIFVVGFGKASYKAAKYLDKILKKRIDKGIVIDVVSGDAGSVKVYAGAHPRPSYANVTAANDIVNIVSSAEEDDLVIVVVSGGGSALLCWPKEECDKSNKVYNEFLKTGSDIRKLNILRRHISSIKGGGLAKMAYPATVVGLVFSDIPGGHYSSVASGPTYKDETTLEDAKEIIKEYSLNIRTSDLVETPKDDKYFANVKNMPIVSNTIALMAMEKEAEKLGLTPILVSDRLYDFADEILDDFFERAGKGTAILGGGEMGLVVKKAGSGGRNLYLSMKAVKRVGKKDVFISLASDGIDNSDAAGAVVDYIVTRRAQEFNLDIESYINNFDAYTFFEKLNSLIITDVTGINISDLMVLVRS